MRYLLILLILFFLNSINSSNVVDIQNTFSSKSRNISDLSSDEWNASIETWWVKDCPWNNSKDFSFKINTKLDGKKNRKIGQIMMQYFYSNKSCYGKNNHPILRLRYIEIEEKYRRKHHASRAIETMLEWFLELNCFPKNTHVWLECNPKLFDGSIVYLLYIE